jgi:hypothetical protein
MLNLLADRPTESDEEQVRIDPYPALWGRASVGAVEHYGMG